MFDTLYHFKVKFVHFVIVSNETQKSNEKLFRTKRKKVIKGFQQEIAKGRGKLQTDVTEILKTYIKRLKNKIDGNFHRFDEMLQKEEQQIASLGQEQKAITQRLEELHRELAAEQTE